MPLSPEVTRINPNGVTQLSKDVHFLTDFVGSLENAFMLEQNLDELQQTVALMESDNHDEFFDISTRNKKYGRVDAMNGPILLEKYVWSLETFDVLQNTNRPSQTYPHGRDTDQDRPGTDIVELLLALRPEVNPASIFCTTTEPSPRIPLQLSFGSPRRSWAQTGVSA